MILKFDFSFFSTNLKKNEHEEVALTKKKPLLPQSVSSKCGQIWQNCMRNDN